MKVNLKDVIESIEFENEYLTHYYNKNTGVITYVEDSSMSQYSADNINDLQNYEDWEQEIIKNLYDIKENLNDYIQLPKEEDINEHGMLVEFYKSIDENFDTKVCNSYSVKKLRELIENAGEINNWYDYREKSEHQLAIDWCNKNNIEYIE